MDQLKYTVIVPINKNVKILYKLYQNVDNKNQVTVEGHHIKDYVSTTTSCVKLLYKRREPMKRTLV